MGKNGFWSLWTERQDVRNVLPELVFEPGECLSGKVSAQQRAQAGHGRKRTPKNHTGWMQQGESSQCATRVPWSRYIKTVK